MRLGAGCDANQAIAESAATGISLGTAAPAIYSAGVGGLATDWVTGQTAGSYAYQHSETVQNVSQAIVDAIVEFPRAFLNWIEGISFRTFGSGGSSFEYDMLTNSMF